MPVLFAFLFGTPLTALATAAGAVAIPIVIHLLNRKRYRVVTWAAMRFLLNAQKKNARRLRLEQLLLLAVRTLLLLLLVLAMASVLPWAESLWRGLFPESLASEVAGAPRTHKILVLDGSFGMATRVDGASYFDKAKALADALIQQSPRGDGFSVVLMGAPPTRVVSEASLDATKVNAAVQALRLPHGNADLPGTLAVVDDLLRQSPGKFEGREVYFLTGLQQSSWLARPPASMATTLRNIQKKAQTILVDVGRDGLSNTAVTSLTLSTSLVTVGNETAVKATVHLYGPESRENVRVTLAVGKVRAAENEPPLEMQVVQEKVLSLARGDNTVNFPHRFSKTGDYVVQVRTESDALALDDTRSAVVRVKDNVPVLLVNGKVAADPFDQATEWLRLALNPFDNKPVPGFVPARPKVISESQFADAAAGDLSPYDCVCLCDVARVGVAEARRLETHLRTGGGLVISLGNNVDRDAYNDVLFRKGAGLLPAELKGKQQAPDKTIFRLTLDDKAPLEPPLDAFSDPGDRASLLEPRFHTYLSTRPVASARKVLTFLKQSDAVGGAEKAGDLEKMPDGEPAVLEWQPSLPRTLEGKAAAGERCRGRVLLITTTLNCDWNAWAVTHGFLPVMQEMLRYAVAGRLREQAQVVGDPLEEYIQGTTASLEARVQPPDGDPVIVRTQTADDASLLRWTDTAQSGLYQVTFHDERQRYLRDTCFAVNVPAASDTYQISASDPARATREDLRTAYPEWDLQVVTDPANVKHHDATGTGEEGSVLRPLGPGIARWLLLIMLALMLVEVPLACYFGHFSSVAGTPGSADKGRAGRWWLVGPAALFAVVSVLGLILGHYAWTGDFLGFLPDDWRGVLERVAGIPAPPPGEGRHWRLDFTPYLWDALADPWLAGALALLSAGMVGAVYRLEGATAGPLYKVMLGGLRVSALLLMLAVLLPRVSWYFERESWPDVALVLDDSQSMSTADRYQDPRIQEAADRLAKLTGASAPERLELAKALVARDGGDWLSRLLSRHKVKVHVYHCSTRTARLADLTEPENLDDALQAVSGLTADATHDSSQLGAAVRQVLNDFRGTSLAAVVMLTDGVTTEGENLAHAAKVAAQEGVPLFFVGLGDAHEAHDLALHDLRVRDTVYVNDRVEFKVQLTAHGYTDLTVPVRLREKGGDKVLAEQLVKVDPQGKPQEVRLEYKPTEPGEKIYIVEVPEQPDETRKDNNRIERAVSVREDKLLHVLYVEGYPRYEFRFIKALLERESAKTKGNKSIDLKVVLLDADPQWASQDKSALSEIPTKTELNKFDVIILGDVDPRASTRIKEDMQNLADYVRERGGSLLMLAGPRSAPHAYRDSPLRDILPLDVTADRQPDDPRGGLFAGYKLEWTPLARDFPAFRFLSDDVENQKAWDHLAEMYWWSQGYEKKRAAEVLAVYPGSKLGNGPRHPLVLRQFVGAGQCMFFGFEETWRWQLREDKIHFNQFWIQLMRDLARSRIEQLELRLEKPDPTRVGQPVRIVVRFPDNEPAPAPDSPVKVTVERRFSQSGGPPITEVQTVQLAKVEGSRATYDGLLTRTPQGDYRFWVSEPAVPGNKARAECRILAPPGEMEQVAMNQREMESAAKLTKGGFATLADADQMLDQLPAGTRELLNAPGPPLLLWNHALMFALMLLLLSTEWILRKHRHLL
jgi:hypothetical protein